MAKQKSTAQECNVLISNAPTDTLNHCAAVLEFVAGSNSDGSPTDNYDFGRHLVLTAVADALRYESGRVEVRRG
ncbi:MAG: hypothetical protein KDI87_07895 [Gammaproteobacteria bacterium]|nr:hypothetical protein [Gammaproteobacteria bacterium]